MITTMSTSAVDSVTLGQPVPPATPHAISVSLPTWKDNVGYEEGEKRVVDSMLSGYPRFFVHLSIRRLAEICEQRHAIGDEKCMLFPSRRIANECRRFIKARSAQIGGQPVEARLVQFPVSSGDHMPTKSQRESPNTLGTCADLHVVFFSKDALPIAREFWQHTGLGISSRLAEKCLSLLSVTKPSDAPDPKTRASSLNASHFPMKSGPNRHYSSKNLSRITSALNTADILSDDQTDYLEERYGRNLPATAGASAKRALRRRIAGVLIRDTWNDSGEEPLVGKKDLELGPSSRGVASLTEDDVYLFPCGMAAIWNAHKIAKEVRPEAKSVCFGFPYTDTLKILQKWGPGAHFFGNGLDEDIDSLEALLEREAKVNPSKPPILALFTEFPSNPLLRSPNLQRLRTLADKYDFLLIIDETIGNFVSVEVLPYADIVVSSLTKVFSGSSNVMGGSLVLNPEGRHYSAIKAYLAENYEDVYFDEDAIYMERNSRDFKRRVKIIDANTAAVCEFLRSRSVAGGYQAKNTAIKDVFYPRYATPANYEMCRTKKKGEEREDGGYGGLFSLTFTSTSASKTFFDALPCFKGPSLGTNFTLACPYTILAHYAELDWAAQFGVEEGLVRVSVGMENTEDLLRNFSTALEAAEGSNVH